MYRNSSIRLSRQALCSLGRRGIASIAIRPHAARRLVVGATRPAAPACFSTNARLAYPLSPEALATAKPAPLTDDEYHMLADEYIEAILSELEEIAEKRTDVDVEYSSGVLNLSIPELGDYVINKQPPNKQIWLSSPTAGPKRYDYVLTSADQNAKQDTAVGEWVYLRDGSTLEELLYEEVGVKIQKATPGAV